MQIKKVKIYTNIEKTNTDNNPQLEVEQKLTLTSDGKVQFFSSLYGHGYPHYKKGRKVEITIEPDVMKEVFNEIEQTFATQSPYNIIPGFGMWELTVVEKNNRNHHYYGATSGVHNALTSFIAHRLPIEHLMTFGE